MERDGRHRVFAGAVACALALGVVAAVATAVPHPVPGLTLKSEYVYRSVVGSMVFFLLYVPVTLVWLALHGKTLERFGMKHVAEVVLPALDEARDRFAAALESLEVFWELFERKRAESEARIAELETKNAELAAENADLKGQRAREVGDGDG